MDFHLHVHKKTRETWEEMVPSKARKHVKLGGENQTVLYNLSIFLLLVCNYM